LLTNYEIDVLAECDELTQVLSTQFRHDLAQSREIVLKPRRYVRRPALVGTPATTEPRAPASHKRSAYEISTAAALALGRMAGGLRRVMLGAAALAFLILAVVLLWFPRVVSLALAIIGFWLAVGFLVYGTRERRAYGAGDPDREAG